MLFLRVYAPPDAVAASWPPCTDMRGSSTS